MNGKLNGGILHFNDIMSLQRPCTPTDIKTLLTLMEIWGDQENETNDLGKDLETLKTQRQRALENLRSLCLKLTDFDAQLKTLGQNENILMTRLLQSFKSIIDTICKIKAYFDSKLKPSSSHALFPSLSEPSVWQVGAIIELRGGHTREFSWKEELRLNTHLLKAEFGDT